ncbi:MAG TPA: DeoR family transcriptional regulator [Candidatus Paceibacterota bacterium]|nr:DeoR family transcriptional regulator [Candidatus Paceibacterota bacterium]
MEYSGKERFILTKAYEVAYALFRLAAQMQEKDFAGSLRVSGTALLAAAAGEDYAAAGRELRVMECLVKFGGDAGIIGTPNTDVMMREIYALDAAVAERRNAPKTDEVNVAEIFSKPEIAEHATAEPAPVSASPAPISRSEKEPAMEKEPLHMHGEPAIRQSANDSAIRQDAILSLIRQSGNCRLKEIQEILPDCSERTIRYDLQTLLERGAIERVGVAGPSVFYRTARPEGAFADR